MPSKSSSSEETIDGNLSIKNIKKYFKYNHYKKLLINPKEEIRFTFNRF